MGELVDMADFVSARIAEHRDQMQLLMLESRLLIDLAVESKYDFSKIAQAREALKKAEWHSNEIKRLEAMSFTMKHKKRA